MACRTSSADSTNMVTPIRPSSTCQAAAEQTTAPATGPRSRAAQTRTGWRCWPRDEPAAQRRGLLRTDAAHQQHGVQVDMRVEQREGCRLRQRRAAAQTRATRGRLQLMRLLVRGAAPASRKEPGKQRLPAPVRAPAPGSAPEPGPCPARPRQSARHLPPRRTAPRCRRARGAGPGAAQRRSARRWPRSDPGSAPGLGQTPARRAK
jgi:hypothetical protein